MLDVILQAITEINHGFLFDQRILADEHNGKVESTLFEHLIVELQISDADAEIQAAASRVDENDGVGQAETRDFDPLSVFVNVLHHDQRDAVKMNRRRTNSNPRSVGFLDRSQRTSSKGALFYRLPRGIRQDLSRARMGAETGIQTGNFVQSGEEGGSRHRTARTLQEVFKRYVLKLKSI